MPDKRVISAHLSLLLCNLIWACDYPFYSLVLGHYVSPLAMASASLIVAALLSLVPLFWERSEPIARADIPKICVAALLMGVLRKLCMMYGMSLTSPIDGSIISTITPLLVLLMSVAVGIESLTTRKVVGVTLGMAGALAVIMSGSGIAHARSDIDGNLLILFSAVVSALYMVYFKRIVGRYRVTTLLRWIYCLSAAVMLPFGMHDLAETDLGAMNWHIVAALLFVLIVPTYLPNLLLNRALQYVAPTLTSIYAYLQPVVAIALSVAMGLDRLHADTLLFALVIFVGVAMVSSSYARRT